MVTFLEGREEDEVEGRSRELAERFRQVQMDIRTGKGTSTTNNKMTPPKPLPSQAEATQRIHSRIPGMTEAKSFSSSSSEEETNYLSDEEAKSKQNVLTKSK